MSELTPELLNTTTWKIPNGLAIVGSHHEKEFNGMTASWISQFNMDPVTIGVGIDNTSLTHSLISRNGFFSLNFFSSDNTKVFVKFSKPAKYTDGYLNEEPVTLTTNNVPIFNNSVLWFELKVINSQNLGTHTLYLGKVLDCYLKDGDFKVAEMSDTRMKYGGVPRGGHNKN